MNQTRSHPLLYEVYTRCWLGELSEQAGAKIHLGNAPEEQVLQWKQLGFTHIWLMGVWTTGPRGRAHSAGHPDLLRIYNEVLPDWQRRDVVGSPYAIADYRVSSKLGGEIGLQLFREQLRDHGLKLILDFVPNHLARDHPWLVQQPDLFVQAPAHKGAGFRRMFRRKS